MSHRTPIFHILLGLALTVLVLASCQASPTPLPSPTVTPTILPSPTATPFQLPGRARTDTSIWEGPDTFAFKSIANIKVRQEVRITGRYGQFFLIESDGQKGFIAQDSTTSDFDTSGVPLVKLDEIPPISTISITSTDDAAPSNANLPISSAAEVLIDVQTPPQLTSPVTIMLLEHHPKLTKEVWQQKYLEFRLDPDGQVALIGKDGTQAQDAGSVATKEIGKFTLTNPIHWGISLGIIKNNLTSIAVVDGGKEQGLISSAKELPFSFLQDATIRYAVLRKLYIGLQSSMQGVAVDAKAIPDGSRASASWLVDVSGDPVAVADRPITNALSNNVVHLADFGYGLPTSIVYSTDGGLLAVGTKGGRVLIYETGTYEIVQILDTELTLRWDEDEANQAVEEWGGASGSIAISSDNELVAVTGIDATLMVLKITGETLFTSKGDYYADKTLDHLKYDKNPWGLRIPLYYSFIPYFDPKNETVMVTVGQGGTKAQWQPIYKVFSIPDGKRVDVFHEDYQSPSGWTSEIYYQLGSRNLEYFYEWRHDQRFRAYRDEFTIYHRIDWQNFEKAATIKRQAFLGEGNVDSVSNNGRFLAYELGWYNLLLIDSVDQQRILTLSFKEPPRQHGFISDDERSMVLLKGDWDSFTFQRPREAPQVGDSEAMWHGEVWSLDEKTKTGEFSFPADAYYAIRNDAKSLAYVMPYGIYVLSLPEGKVVREIPFGTCTGNIRLQPNGRLLASFYYSTIYVCDGRTGELLRHIKVPTGRITSLAFSPDGGMLASSGQTFTKLESTGTNFDPIIYLWRVADGSLLKKLVGHRWNVGLVAFSPDGKYLASGTANHLYCVDSPDKRVLLWNIETGEYQEVTSLPTGIEQIAFEASGRTMILRTTDRRGCGRAASATYTVNLGTSQKKQIDDYSFPGPLDLPNGGPLAYRLGEDPGIISVWGMSR